MADAPMMVVETADFLKHATRLMTDSEREALAAFVEANPEAGEIMPETGGCVTQRAAAGVPAHRVPEEPEGGESQQVERNAMKRLVADPGGGVSEKEIRRRWLRKECRDRT